MLRQSIGGDKKIVKNEKVPGFLKNLVDEVKKKFALGNTRNVAIYQSNRVCKGVFHLQGWNDD